MGQSGGICSIDLDEKDRIIVSLFEKNPDISQAEIAEQVGLSQPTVGARISKLKQSGVISMVAGMSLMKVGLKLAKVDVTAKNSVELLNKFRSCPYFLNGFVVSGRENLCLFFIAEDASTLDAIVDKHIRSDPSVIEADLGIVMSSVNEMIQPLRLSVEKGEKTPCGLNCVECGYYTSGRCLGCCASKAYKGSFW
ncbi:Lrp/AsnC family transcriptional regulator [Methanocella conradii]|uniref:Lrp/AsnC family transcriptional regulator n=1 Tax=Methanocella conradii TaxID=1175444 RepID=UPI0024B35C3F|nr:Lrp/AsnC family transcriptional regulator [Methanocella conradii]MDI6897041.1 Lrp/AsnC family transcriptional regulator [Methanocella conradii]